MADYLVTDRRGDLANKALFEITKISEVLREYISRQDSSGEIAPVARGMLARVQALSEAVDVVLGNDDEVSPWPDDRLAALIENGCP